MKSKINIKSIIILSIIAIISLFFINMSLASSTGKIIVETANLRETPDENSKILELFSMDKQVEVIEKVNNWYKVKIDGITGYLREDLITVEGEVKDNTTSQQTNQTETAQTTEEAPSEQTDVIEEPSPVQEGTTEQNVKEAEIGKNIVIEDTALKIVPVINATNTITIKKDEQVDVIEFVNNWACVETTTGKGWIRKEKLQKQENNIDTNIEQPEPTATPAEIPPAETQPTETQQNETATQETQVAPTEQTTPTNQEQQTTPTTEAQTVNKTLYVKDEGVNLRQQANTTASIISVLSVNTEVNVTEEANGWSKVKVNGAEGYILSSLLSEQKQVTARSQSTPRQSNSQTETQSTSQANSTNTTTPQANNTQATQQTATTTSNTQAQPATSTAPTTQTQPTNNNTTAVTTSSKGSAVAETAKKYIGYKYVWGGTSPSTGFDCSGFAQYVYKQNGVSLNRTAAAQTGNGTAVDKSNLQPGDLVFFGKGGIDHVGIYIGGGQMVHASNSTRGVRTDNITSGYYNNKYACARRIF